MAEASHPSDRRIEIRKYPNRRYYDGTRRRHLTLEEIHALVRDGHDVRVIESRTGEDITPKVLAQIILEIDTPKLDIFPVALLHQVIRANEPLIRDFIEKYFNQALAAFLQSQRHFEGYLRHAVGLGGAAGGAEWTRLMMAPFIPPLFAPAPAAKHAPEPANHGERADDDLRQTVDELRAQLQALERKLGRKA